MPSLLIFIGAIRWVYQGCFWNSIRYDKCRLSWQAFDIYRGYEFIKVVSNTVLDTVNVVYHDNLLIFIGAIRWVYQGWFSHCIRHGKCPLSCQSFDIYRSYTFEFIKVVSDTVLDMINSNHKIIQTKPTKPNQISCTLILSYYWLVFSFTNSSSIIGTRHLKESSGSISNQQMRLYLPVNTQ